MRAFKRESASYIFELNNNAVTVSCKKDYGKLNKFEGEGFTEYGSIQGMPYILVIHDFLEKTKSNQEASNIIQLVLSSFFHTFEKNGDQREQLRKGLRYFSLADHYGVLKAAFPQETLDGARLNYNKFNSSLEGLNKDFYISEQMVQKYHISEPMVSSTGLIVYSTLNENWYIFETNERHKELPEYLFSVISHTDFKLVTRLTSDFTGTQNECQQYVQSKQKEIYGISLGEFKALDRKITMTRRLIEDLEILLDVPYEKTLQGIQELKEKEEAIQNTVATNLHHLNLT